MFFLNFTNFSRRIFIPRKRRFTVASREKCKCNLLSVGFVSFHQKTFKPIAVHTVYSELFQACQNLLKERYLNELKREKFPLDYDGYESEDEINLGLLPEGMRVVEIEKVCELQMGLC